MTVSGTVMGSTHETDKVKGPGSSRSLRHSPAGYAGIWGR